MTCDDPQDLPIQKQEPDVYFFADDVTNSATHTILYGLEPLGAGTGACESLKSYLCRLADEHRISVKSLMMDILHGELCEKSGYWKSDIRTVKGKSCFVSMGGITQGLIDVLQEFTGRDNLAGCTMIPLQHVIASKGLLANEERHCPLCIGGPELNKNSYGRLIWDRHSAPPTPGT